MSYLSLSLPGGGTVNAPGGVPQGGLDIVQTIFGNLLTIMITLAIIFTVIGLIWSGIQMISSGGDKSKMQSARARLTWSIIGLVIALSTFLILNIIGYFFKIDLLNIGV